MRRAKSLYVFLAVFIIAVTQLGQTAEDAKTRSSSAFKQLASLEGEWEGAQDGVPTRIKETYTLTAGGSALMAQTKPADDAEMITMFVVDGDRLIATHYCSAQNQPEMTASKPGDLERGLSFSLTRVTGMKTPDDWHNTGLTIKMDDKDHITQWWTYLYKGKTGTSEFHYTRMK